MSTWKKTTIWIVVFIAFTAAVIHVGRYMAVTTGPTSCVDEQKLVEVTPIGHRRSTSYIVRGENGGTEEYFNAPYPPRVGFPYCFREHTETYSANFWTLERTDK